MRTSAASSLPSIQGAMSTHVYVRTREPYCSAPEPNPRGLCPMLIVESRLHIRRHARAPSHLRRRFRVGSQRWGGMGIACRVGIRQSLRGWDVAPFERRSWGYGVGWGRRGVQIKLAISGHATAPLIRMFLTAALFWALVCVEKSTHYRSPLSSSAIFPVISDGKEGNQTSFCFFHSVSAFRAQFVRNVTKCILVKFRTFLCLLTLLSRVRKFFFRNISGKKNSRILGRKKTFKGCLYKECLSLSSVGIGAGTERFRICAIFNAICYLLSSA